MKKKFNFFERSRSSFTYPFIYRVLFPIHNATLATCVRSSKNELSCVSSWKLIIFNCDFCFKVTCEFKLQWKWRMLSEFNTFLIGKQLYLYHYSARGLTSTVVKRTCHSINGWFVKILLESLLKISDNLVIFIMKETVYSWDSVPWDCTHVVRKPCINRVVGSTLVEGRICNLDKVVCNVLVRFENFQDFKTVFCKNFLLLNSAIFFIFKVENLSLFHWCWHFLSESFGSVLRIINF